MAGQFLESELLTPVLKQLIADEYEPSVSWITIVVICAPPRPTEKFPAAAGIQSTGG